MKIVIDIDDEQVLFDIKSRGLEAKSETDKVIINALYNAIPLPKEHGRLIDVDDIALIDEQFYVPSDYYVAESAINDAPTIIEGSDSE